MASTVGREMLTDDEVKDSVALKPSEHLERFSPREYLTSFYSTHNDDSAMGTVLFFLPGYLYRIPEGGTVLDIGSGPCVHIALAFRNRADTIFLSDYAPQNRKALLDWLSDSPEQFDWTNVVEWILCLEGADTTVPDRVSIAQRTARAKVGGVLEVDVLDQQVVLTNAEDSSGGHEQYDVITSIFCLEYATENKQQYQQAFRNVLSLLKLNGYLLLGGVFCENSYYFGQTKFGSFYLTESVLFDTLRQNGIDTTSRNDFRLIQNDSVFLLVGRKTFDASRS